VFHTHKAPSLFSFILRTQRQTWPFKLLAPPSQAQWQRAQFFCLPCPLSLFHTHKALLNWEAHQIFKCLPNLLHKMWSLHFLATPQSGATETQGNHPEHEHLLLHSKVKLSQLHKMWWDLFSPLHHGFPSFHNSTLDSKSRLGNLGVWKHPLPLLVPICVFWWVTPAQLESFE
jgi:hypothetical protein